MRVFVPVCPQGGSGGNEAVFHCQQPLQTTTEPRNACHRDQHPGTTYMCADRRAKTFLAASVRIKHGCKDSEGLK